jgi:tetratricopeptide (TPR) repeat protein
MAMRYPAERRASCGALRVAAVVLGFGSLLATGCSDDGPQLVPLITPELGRLEPAVRDELTIARQRLDALVATPGEDPQRLGAAYGDLGRLYHAHELLEAALPCYRNAELLQPGEVRWPYLMGHVLTSLHMHDAALSHYELALESDPEDPSIRLALARLHRESGRADEARRLTEEILSRDPESPGTLLLAAELAVDRADSHEAVRLYERLLELQPAATRLYQPLAIAWRDLGDVERARELLDRVGSGVLQVPDPLLSEMRALGGGANHELQQGLAAYQAGNFEGAVQAFARAVEIAPDLVRARTYLGTALTKLDRFDAAATEFRTVLSLDPGNSLARFNLGVIAGKQGRFEEAEGHYESALAIDPRYRDARYNLANLLRAGSRCAEALDHYRRVVEEDPASISARLGELLCLIESEDATATVQRLEEALVALPEHAILLDSIARILAAAKIDGVRDGERALELARRAAGPAPTARQRETLAMALAELGRFEEAIAAMQLAIDEAEAAGATAALAAMRANLRAFEHGEPCRDPAL